MVTVGLSAAGGSTSTPLMWRVSSGGSSAQVYLLGSIHFGQPDMYPLPKSVREAFAASELLAVELDVDAVDPQRVAGLVNRGGRLQKGDTLREHLDRATWSRLESVCLTLGLNPEQFLTMKPWLVAMQLVNLQLQQAKYKQELGIDRHFLRLAQGNKRLIELETIEQQLGIFSRLSLPEQQAMLRQTLDDYERGDAYLRHIEQAWRLGDAVALEESILAVFKDGNTGGRLYRLVFSERNVRMSASVEQFLSRSQNVFMVVGVGHMLGQDGIIARLRKSGYKIEQVSPSGVTGIPFPNK